MKAFNESNVPKAILKPSLGIGLIQKCLWILHKKSDHKKTEHQALSVFEVVIGCAFRN
jgi:hypothetical protein